MSDKYSKVTLIPRDELERTKFRSFRNEDVFYMFRICCILSTCEVVLLLGVLVYTLANEGEAKLSVINLVY